MDKLQKMYDLFVKEGILTEEKSSFESWSNATPEMQAKLFEVAKKKNLFGDDTAIETFTAIWGDVKKKDNTEIFTQEEEVMVSPGLTDPDAGSLDVTDPGSINDNEVNPQEQQQQPQEQQQLTQRDELGGREGEEVRIDIADERQDANFSRDTQEENTILEDVIGKNFLTDFVGDIYRAGKQGFVQGNTADESFDLMFSGSDASPQDIQEFLAAQAELQSMGETDEMRSFNEIYEEAGGGVLGFLKGLAFNPTVATQLAAQTVTQMINPASAGAAGAVIAGGAALGGTTGMIGGPVGGGAGALAGSIASLPVAFGAAGAALETGMSFAEFLREAVEENGDSFDQAGIRKVLDDPDAMFNIRAKSAGRGAVIGIIDRYSMKMGGKVIGGMAAKGASKGKRFLTATAVEGVGGGVGEAAARLAVGQDMDAREIGFEAIGGAGKAPFTYLYGKAMSKPKYKINGGEVSLETYTSMLDKADDKDFAAMNFEVDNDGDIKALTEARKKKLKIQNQVIKEVGQDNIPNKETLDELVNLETEKQNLGDPQTEGGKKRLAELNDRIKGILDGTIDVEVSTETDADGNTVNKRVEVSEEYTIQKLNEEGIENPTQEQIDQRQAELMEEGKQTNNENQEADAIQESSPTEVDVQEQTEDSSDVGDGDTSTNITEEGNQQTESETTTTTEEEVSTPEETLQESQDLEALISEDPTNENVTTEETEVDTTPESETTVDETTTTTEVETNTDDTKQVLEGQETVVDNGDGTVTIVPAGNKTSTNPTKTVAGKTVDGTDNVYIIGDNDNIDTKYEGDEVARDKQENFIVELAKKAAKAAKLIIPGVNLVLHRTEQSYNNATNQNSDASRGNAGSRGLYSGGRNDIHINVANASAKTIAHEVFHAILYNKYGNDNKIANVTKRMVLAVEKTLTDGDLKRKLKVFSDNYTSYQDEEYLSELIGTLADNYKLLKAPEKSIIKKWIAKVSKMVGFPVDVSTESNVLDVLDTIAKNIKEGKDLKEADIDLSEFEGGKEVNSPSDALKTEKVGGFEVKYTQFESIKKMIKEGLITEPKDVAFLENMFTTITSPDDMLAGEISFDDKVIFEGEGGVFFVTKFGDVWASGKVGTANTIATALNKQLKQNGGKAFLTLTKGTDSKLVSSASGVNSTLAILNTMLDKKLISPSIFRAAASTTIKKAGGEINLRQSAKDLKSDIKKYFTDPTTSTFEKRGFIVKDIVGEIAKNLPKESQGAIAEFLGGDGKKNVGVGNTPVGKKSPGSQALVELVAKLAAEKLTKGLNTGDVYAVIEVNSEVEVKKDSHPSYPFHISLKDGSKPVLHLIKKRENGSKVLVQKGQDGNYNLDYAVRNVSVVEGQYNNEAASTAVKEGTERRDSKKKSKKSTVSNDRQQKTPAQNVTKIAQQNGINQSGFFSSNLFNPAGLRKQLEKQGYGLKAAYRSYGQGDLTGYYITKNGRKFNPPSNDRLQQVDFSQDDSLTDIVDKARKLDFKDLAIADYLKRVKKISAKEIKALLDETAPIKTLFDAIPRAFGNVEGGMALGKQIYESVSLQLQQYITDKKPTNGEMRQKALDLLKANSLFQAQPAIVQDQLISAYDRSLTTTANRKVAKVISGIRKGLQKFKQGVESVKKGKARLRQLIRTTLPKGEYSDTVLKKVARLIDKATDASFFVDAQEVLKIIDAQRQKQKIAVIKQIQKIVSAKAKKRMTTTGKERSGGLDAEGQQFFQTVNKILKLALTDPNALQSLIERLSQPVVVVGNKALTVDEVIAKELSGEKLTVKESQLLEMLTAVDTFADIDGMSLEDVKELLSGIKDVRSESIKRLSANRIRRAVAQSQLDAQVISQIQENFPFLFNEDGTLKNRNDINQDKRGVWDNFQKLKVWDGIKQLYTQFDFATGLGIADFFRKRIAHLGTLTNLMDNVAKGNNFFVENIYNRINRMETKALEGKQRIIESMTEGLGGIANSIEGITKGYKELLRKLPMGTRDFIINGKKQTFTIDEMMRMYALNKNDVQAEKFLAMGITKEVMSQIASDIGPLGREFVDKVVMYLSNEYFEETNATFKQVNDVNLSYVANYFPTSSLTENVDKMISEDGGANFNGIFNAEYDSAFKKRVDQSSPIELGLGFTDVLNSHIDSMERYKAFAEGTKILNNIFSVPAVNLLIDEMGIKAVVKNIINASVNPNSGLKQVRTKIDKMMSKFTQYALSFKLVQIAKQSTSFVNAFEDYNYRGNGKPRIPGMDTIGFMMDIAEVIVTLPKQFKKAKEISADFRNRIAQGLEGDVYGLESGSRTFKPLNAKATKVQRMIQKFKTAAASPTIIGDIMGVMGYMANYNRNIKNGMSEADALQAFNNYNATQQSRRNSDKNMLQLNSNELVRAFTMFGSTLFLQMNKVMSSTNNIMKSLKEGDITSKQGLKKKAGAVRAKDIRGLAINMAVANILFVAVANMAKLTGDDEDEDEVMSKLKDAAMGLNLLYQVPLIGGAAELMITKARGERGFGDDVMNPYKSVFRKVSKGIKAESTFKTAQPLFEIIIGAQIDPAVGLFNLMGADIDDGSDMENVYKLLGISPSYQPANDGGDGDSTKRTTRGKANSGKTKRQIR
tara:strand:- start:14863 stop:22647 length:7785 start_codon:yes stop_codon:yes gene_type:complete